MSYNPQNANGQAAMANSAPVVIASDQSNLPVAIQAGSAIIGKITTDQTTHGTTDLVAADITKVAGNAISVGTGVSGTGVIRVALITDQPQLTNKLLVTPDSVALPSNQSVNNSQVAGTNISVGNGVSGSGVQRVVVASDQTAFSVNSTVVPATSGGLSTFHLVSAGSTNATNIKASAGQVYGWFIYNSNAAARKVIFHNTAGTPTAGASVFFSLMIPPTSGANVDFSAGIAFGTGIAITTTTGLADSDSAAVAANDLIINIFYK